MTLKDKINEIRETGPTLKQAVVWVGLLFLTPLLLPLLPREGPVIWMAYAMLMAFVVFPWFYKLGWPFAEVDVKSEVDRE